MKDHENNFLSRRRNIENVFKKSFIGCCNYFWYLSDEWMYSKVYPFYLSFLLCMYSFFFKNRDTLRIKVFPAALDFLKNLNHWQFGKSYLGKDTNQYNLETYRLWYLHYRLPPSLLSTETRGKVDFGRTIHDFCWRIPETEWKKKMILVF